MPPEPQELLVRAHERRGCDLAASAVVDPACGDRVALSTSAVRPEGGFDARLVDFSAGGVGLRTGLFMPVGCALVIQVRGPKGEAISVRGTVRRVQMVGRGPEFYLGLAFASDEVEALGALSRVVQATGAGGAA